jgi:DNA invertase Pin-like site-specific DNA recombinase
MYVRVSSKEQEQGFSIPAQRQLLKDYAERKGIHVVQEFEDVETAKRAGRTSFSEMVAFVAIRKPSPSAVFRCRPELQVQRVQPSGIPR